MSSSGVDGGRFRDAKKCSRRVKPKSAMSPMRIAVLLSPPSAHPTTRPTTRPTGSRDAFAALAVITIVREAGGTSIDTDCARPIAIHTGRSFAAGSANRTAGKARAAIPLHGQRAKRATADAYTVILSGAKDL